MKILLVEDEIHKRDEIIGCVELVFGYPPDVVGSVQSAVIKAAEEDYDLIILDMALPTFGDCAEDSKKGHDQAQGGVEVLRALKGAGKEKKIIVVTQYPDFYIGGTRVKLKDSAKIIKEKYNQDIVGAVLYNYKSSMTIRKIVASLRGVNESTSD